MPIQEKGITPAPSIKHTPTDKIDTWLEQLQTRFPKVNTYNPSIDLALIGATSYSTQTFSVPGLNINDVLVVNPPSLTVGLYLITYGVDSADTLSMTFYNSTGGGINEAESTFKIIAIRL